MKRAILTIALLVGGLAFYLLNQSPKTLEPKTIKESQASSPITTKPKEEYKAQNFESYIQKMTGLAESMSMSDLVTLDKEKLKDYPVELMSFILAKDLPTEHKIEAKEYFSKITEIANRVVFETDRHMYRFEQNPEEFNHSEEEFRTKMLATVLGTIFKIKYTKGLLEQQKAPIEEFSRDSADVFMTGTISKAEGTCASMPILITAVSRLIGYPVYVVPTMGHLFARWSDDYNHINIEYSGYGVNFFPDDHYKKWPYEIREEDLKWYFKNMEPIDELTMLLGQRGVVLEANGRYGEANIPYLYAKQLDSDFLPNHLHLTRNIKKSWKKKGYSIKEVNGKKQWTKE